MDRLINYPGAIPLETDLLNTNKNTMIALAKLVAATLGTTTQVNGLSVVQTTVASLQVNVNPGEIYSLQNVDNTAFSSLAADTAHQIMKQGISLNQVLLNCPAPGTVGQSINYLIEASYQDTDALPVVLPYYNAANPATAFSGANNLGVPNNTVRQGAISLVAKAGTAAATGSQTTPAVDAGYTAIYVVTVAYGQTQITAPNIVAVVNAPFINSGMLGQVATLLNSPAQFDNSLKVASTAWVTNRGLAYSSTSGLNFATSQTLSVSNMGGWGIVVAASLTLTMPPVASVEIGASFTFINQFPVTIKGNASETIFPIAGGSANTFSAYAGESITITSNGSAWYLTQDGISASAAFAVNQTWQSVVRVLGTTYTNSTGRAITVSASITNAIAGYVTVTSVVAGSSISIVTNNTPGASYLTETSFIVPNGATYSVSVSGTNTPTLNSWYELR